MSYRVTAALVLARDRDGVVHHRYYGTVVNWLDEEQRDHFVKSGLVEDLGDTDDAEESDADDGRPPRTATKAVLVDWLAEKGYDRGELEAQNKPDLVELLDSVE